jgi:hypothetical protein
MSINTITVTGTYKDLLGRAGSGVVQFVPNTDIFEDTNEEIIYTKQIFSARLDAYGKLKAKIPVTDVGNLTPTSFTYTIIEKVTGMKRRTTEGVAVPSTYGETVSITQLI